ncbi:MAG: tyrosine-type recombinase/integrase [Gaiellaceae bacterium]
MLRRAAAGAALDRPDRRIRFHDLRHTYASHLIIDIRLDVVQVSRILGHARTSMTLDTYTHLFEEARHGADVRAELAKSEFANLLTRTLEPRLARRQAPPLHARPYPNTATERLRKAPPLRPAHPFGSARLRDQKRDQNVTDRSRQQNGQRK